MYTYEILTRSRHEWTLPACILLLYYFTISLVIPWIPYLPMVLLIPIVLGLLALFISGIDVPITVIASRLRSGYQQLLILLAFCLFFSVLLGYTNRNGIIYIGTELTFFVVLFFCLLLGANARTWYLIDRPATLMVYFGFILMLLYKDTVADDQVAASFVANNRLTNTVAYGLRPLTIPAVFLYLWGATNDRSFFWKTLQFGTVLPYLASEVGLFQFRSAFVMAAYIALATLLVLPIIKQRSLHWSSYILSVVFVAIALLGFFDEDTSDRFLARISRTDATLLAVFSERNAELEVFLWEMNYEIIFGRGLGGSFDASQVFGTSESQQWRTLHYGAFSLVLRGGLLLLVNFLGLIMFWFYASPRKLANNPIKLAAYVMVPLLLFQLITLPFIVSLQFLPRYIWWTLAIAAIATKD